MGGNQVTGVGTGDDGWDEEGYDESQRAEILEATRDGPSDGNLLTDLNPDLGGDVEEEPIDDLDMEDGEVGETDATVAMDPDDEDEDDAQDAFDDGAALDSDDEDDDADDGEDVATRP